MYDFMKIHKMPKTTLQWIWGTTYASQSCHSESYDQYLK